MILSAQGEPGNKLENHSHRGEPGKICENHSHHGEPGNHPHHELPCSPSNRECGNIAHGGIFSA